MGSVFPTFLPLYIQDPDSFLVSDGFFSSKTMIHLKEYVSYFIHNFKCSNRRKIARKCLLRIKFILILSGKIYFTFKKLTQKALLEHQLCVRIYGKGKWNIEIIPGRQDKLI